MKTALNIAKSELRTLFYSPIAWILTIVFLFQCSLEFTSLIGTRLAHEQIGGFYTLVPSPYTEKIFGVPFGLFGSILKQLYFYLPLLTMGLISRETSSGTIKLLYSSPVKVSHIVIGKYFAMVAYSFLLILILIVFAITGVATIHSADTGLLCAGILSIFLLLCTYSAIGLFMSCLTSYQIVAAISTLAVFSVLNYIGTVWQDVDFVRGITYFLSISGRTTHMIQGLISTKDIIYFGVIISMFVTFSIFKLQTQRESRSTFYIAFKYISVLVVVLLLGYASSIPGFIGYYDATGSKTQTLNSNTQKILKGMGSEPLEVTSYINLLDRLYWRGKPENRNEDMYRWEPFLRFKSNIIFKYVYYYDDPIEDPELRGRNHGKSLKQIAQQLAKSEKIDFNDLKSPGEIRKIIDLRPEYNKYVIQLKYKGKATFLRLFSDAVGFPSENETAAALKRLTEPAPKIIFLEGEYERSGKDPRTDPGYNALTSDIMLRPSLVNQGFDVESMPIKDKDIPLNIAALVIVDPKTNFSPAVLLKLQKYIDNGGNLLIAGEPGRQAVLNPLIKNMGVQLMDGQIVQDKAGHISNMAMPFFTAATGGLLRQAPNIINDKKVVLMPGVAGLTYNTKEDYKATPLLITNEKLSWNKKGKLVTDSAAVVYSPEDGDSKGAFTTLLALTRKNHGKEQRIIISGDADFLSNGVLLNPTLEGENFSLHSALFKWFSYGRFPIDIEPPVPRDSHLNLTDAGLTRLKIIYLGVLPGLLLLFGSVFLLKRKNK